MAKRRIHLGLTGGGIKDVIISNAFFLRELDRQEQERRVNALVRRLLEVVPAQETEHEPQLGKTKLGSVAQRFTDDLIEYSGDVRRVFIAMIFPERHRRTIDDSA